MGIQYTTIRFKETRKVPGFFGLSTFDSLKVSITKSTSHVSKFGRQSTSLLEIKLSPQPFCMEFLEGVGKLLTWGEL